jgi:hypothetical protein
VTVAEDSDPLLEAEMVYLDALEVEYDCWNSELTEAETPLFFIQGELDSPEPLADAVARLEAEYERINESTVRPLSQNNSAIWT